MRASAPIRQRCPSHSEQFFGKILDEAMRGSKFGAD